MIRSSKTSGRLFLRIVIGAILGGLAPILDYKTAAQSGGILQNWFNMAGPPNTTAIVVWATLGSLTAFALTERKSK